ncbi:sugar ABC transporter ATP-binding protein [Kribbella sp. NPDC051620]|uniref:sugar ABC transporter ATP-binding protein n=1 Tax=Kribbella sp. NPDC051620 TaxID=3364120 RepID=UPI0037902012
MDAKVVLGIEDVHQSFGATKALNGVSFEVRRGRVHCLLGGNGSGKSTLIKILAGVNHADAGHIRFGTKRVDVSNLSPAMARKHGLHFVHQQQSTFPGLTVAENLRIGEGFGTPALGKIGWRRLMRESRQVLERFGIDADPSELLRDLRPAVQAMIAIARAVQGQEGQEGGVLVLDEPTASLPLHEVGLLLAAITRFAAEGQSILFVTHRLAEVARVADDVTVLRDGNVVATLGSDEITHDALVGHILGRKLGGVLPRPVKSEVGEPMLQVEELAVGPLRDVTFSLRRGEVVGLAGLLGSGRSTLLQSLFGLRPPRAGRVALLGRSLDLRSPRQAIGCGIAFVPENRLLEAAFTGLDVRENLSIAVASRYFRRGRMARQDECSDARQLIAELAVKVEDIDSPFLSMSGGNQQKIIIGRWIRREPQLLLLDEPSQGVDVGARAEIWRLARELANRGASVLVVSSDLEELAQVADRVLVLRDGRISASMAGPELGEENLNLMLLHQEAIDVDFS